MAGAKGTIVDYAEQVAGEIALKFAGSPLAELRTWVRIAHQREAMVTQLYEISRIGERLRRWQGDGTGPTHAGCSDVICSAVASIWAHEESHTRFLASVRSLSEPFPDFTTLQGQLEGKLTRGAVSGNVVARILIAIGVSLGQAPPFASDLARMTLPELIDFHGQLEATARMGYERILALCGEVEEAPGASHGLGYTVRYDIARILAEERFHQDAFAAMSSWVSGDEASITAAECARALHQLCERNLVVGAVRSLLDPPGHVSKGEPPDHDWVSDGGLGDLFGRYALTVPVIHPDEALARVRG
jgi:hypothetical protein